MGQWTVADRGRVYGEAYEARQRDPVVDIANRASVANGRMSRWQRFNKGELHYVPGLDGRSVACTPNQYRVFTLAMAMVDREMLSMREMAIRLGVAASTVSRALTKLSAGGVLAYVVGRGRWAGLVIIKRTSKEDGWEPMRKAAKERMKRWYEAAQRRLSRLAINVAPYLHDEGVRVLIDPSSSTTSKGATLTAQRKWTPDELRSLGIL